MLRLFAAIEIPEEIGEPLLARQQGIDGARWRPLEALHITLKFIGDVAENVADDLDLELESISQRPFGLELERTGSFGEGADVHAVWAGVAESAPLRQLAKSCEAAARRAGLAPETRAYKPHVTLAYLKRANPAEVAAWIQGNNLLHSPVFAVDRFGLYSSWRTAEGSRYRLEREYRLG